MNEFNWRERILCALMWFGIPVAFWSGLIWMCTLVK